MAKTYTLQIDSAEDTQHSSKARAIRAGEKIGEPFVVLSPAGAIVHDTREDEVETPEPEVEVEEAKGYSDDQVADARQVAQDRLDTHKPIPNSKVRVLLWALETLDEGYSFESA